jgi:hypothetical protein
MSYIYNNKIAYSDSPNIDAFGRLRVSTITSILDVKHNLDKNPLIVDEVTGGTCSSIFNEEFARVRMSAGTSGYVIRQTKKHATYQPGKSQLFEASFSNFQIETDIIKRVGLFESTTAATYNSEFDGLFLESNGVTNQISFQLWRTGTLVYSSDTLSWDSGEIDPSTLDWSKTQLMVSDYQWLGVGRVRFGLSLSGGTYYFTEHNNTNEDVDVYMSSPNQPIRYEIRSSGGTGYFDMLCSQVSTEGPLNQGLYYTVTIPYTAETTLATSGVKYPFIGYRLNPNFPHASSKIDTASIISTSNDDHFITIEFNPTISIGRTWYDLPNTPFQYSFGTGGTETVTSSGFIVGAKVGKAASATQTELDIQDSIIEVGANINGTVDEMWVCLQSTSNNNAKFRGLINLRYYP